MRDQTNDSLGHTTDCWSPIIGSPPRKVPRPTIYRQKSAHFSFSASIIINFYFCKSSLNRFLLDVYPNGIILYRSTLDLNRTSCGKVSTRTNRNRFESLCLLINNGSLVVANPTAMRLSRSLHDIYSTH